jgi:hypothetical protein
MRRSDDLAATIRSFPETSMGVQTVALVLRDGSLIEDVQVAWGRDVARVGGSGDFELRADEIVDVLDRS